MSNTNSDELREAVQEGFNGPFEWDDDEAEFNAMVDAVRPMLENRNTTIANLKESRGFYMGRIRQSFARIKESEFVVCRETLPDTISRTLDNAKQQRDELKEKLQLSWDVVKAFKAFLDANPQCNEAYKQFSINQDPL